MLFSVDKYTPTTDICQVRNQELCQSSSHNSFNRVHPVFCLIENDGLRAFKYLVSHFHTGDAELLMDLSTDGGVQIMECRQAVHETALGTGIVHKLFSDLIGGQCFDALPGQQGHDG